MVDRYIDLNETVFGLVPFKNGTLAIIGENNITVYDENFKMAKRFPIPSDFLVRGTLYYSTFKSLADGSIVACHRGQNIQILDFQETPKVTTIDCDPVSLQLTPSDKLVVISRDRFNSYDNKMGNLGGEFRYENFESNSIKMMTWLNDNAHAMVSTSNPCCVQIYDQKPEVVVDPEQVGKEVFEFKSSFKKEFQLKELQNITNLTTLSNGLLAVGDKNAGLIVIYEWANNALINKAEINVKFRSECALKFICEKHLAALNPKTTFISGT